jgi:hypothetical protein
MGTVNRVHIGVGVVALALLSHASTSAAQSVYVLDVAGIDTTATTRFVVNDEEEPRVAGPRRAFGARAGVSLGARWGVEVDFARSAVSRGDDEARRGLFGSTPGAFGTSASSFVIAAQERHHTVGTLRGCATTSGSGRRWCCLPG